MDDTFKRALYVAELAVKLAKERGLPQHQIALCRKLRDNLLRIKAEEEVA